eukprot:UN28547
MFKLFDIVCIVVSFIFKSPFKLSISFICCLSCFCNFSSSFLYPSISLFSFTLLADSAFVVGSILETVIIAGLFFTIFTSSSSIFLILFRHKPMSLFNLFIFCSSIITLLSACFFNVLIFHIVFLDHLFVHLEY